MVLDYSAGFFKAQDAGLAWRLGHAVMIVEGIPTSRKKREKWGTRRHGLLEERVSEHNGGFNANHLFKPHANPGFTTAITCTLTGQRLPDIIFREFWARVPFLC